MTTSQIEPTNRARATRRPLRASALVVMLIVVGLLGAGCSQISSQLNGETVAAAPAPSVEPARAILVTRQWGVVDGMLSVVVTNTTDRTLHGAEAVITARDDNDVLISTSLEALDGSCCSVTDLPPGQQFGLYIDIGDSADRISRVDVAYRDVVWAPAEETVERPLAAHPVGLESNAAGTVVVADVTSTASMVPQASVQAFLTGPDGEFLAVVAGRWYCFSEGKHQIRMQLLHPVPDGTTIDRIAIHPVTNDPDGTALHCAGPAAPPANDAASSVPTDGRR